MWLLALHVGLARKRGVPVARRAVVFGVNRWTDGLRSPLVRGDDGGVFRADPSKRWRRSRRSGPGAMRRGRRRP
jgi:hypothetical protein